ncbi:MAG: hypothetical protein N3A54_05500 [Patescibacteria group bacterium]|nr:hypothetical protein [Patescibacteria group bacterium]
MERIPNLFVTPAKEGQQPDFILNPELPRETGYMFQEESAEGFNSYTHIEGSRYRVNGKDVYIKRCKTPDTVSWQHPIR